MTYTKTNRGEILDQLRALERQYGFRVLYACESGSRAWGFASGDSDYDVRFLYLHRPEWYLSVRQRPDSVAQLAGSELDLAGWDLRKALGLLVRSNGALLEWLHSPIRYVEHPDLVPLARSVVPDVLNPRALAAHYLGMAWKTWLVIRDGEAAAAKNYLYALRAVLAARWVLSRKSPPPVEFPKLMAEALNEASIRSRCETLVSAKSAGEETTVVGRDTVLDQWLASQIQALKAVNADLSACVPNMEVVDTYFRYALGEVWGGMGG